MDIRLPNKYLKPCTNKKCYFSLNEYLVDFLAVDTISLSPKSYQSGSYVDAQANSLTNISNVVKLSDGTYTDNTIVTWAGHGLTVGVYYYLDQTTAGAYTSTEPTLGIKQRLFYVVDANTIIIDIITTEEITELQEHLKFIAINYSDLLTKVGMVAEDLAYVENSQGTSWLPTTLGGTYYPSGWYIYTGTAWVSDRNDIAAALSDKSFTFTIEFIDETEILFKAPYGMKINSVTLSTPLTYTIEVNAVTYTFGSTINQFDQIRVTSSLLNEVVNLNCEKL